MTYVMPTGKGTHLTQQPRLLDQLRQAIRTRHYSYRTEEAYVHWAKRFIYFHGKRHPRELGEREVTAFINHLASGRGVASSTQNQALSSLLFLYKAVLGRPLDWLDGLQRAKRPARVPTVLSAAEVQRLLNELDGAKWLMASLLYGAGLRLRECLKLRVKDVDFDYRQLIVRDGKGGKDQSHDAASGRSRAVETASRARPGAARTRLASVETTMIYTHVMKKGGRGVMSPLDES